MRTMLTLIGLTVVCSQSLAGELPKPTGKAIVSPDAKLEHLFTRSADISGGLTEGPAIAPDGSIYFSDIPFGMDDGMILRFDPQTKKVTVFTDKSGKSNGLMFDPQGRLVACEGAGYGGRCISRWNVKTGKKEVIADSYMGKRFNSPNDLTIAVDGTIYFTDPRYVGHEPRELEHRAVYRIEPDGTVHEATHNVEKPNGIGLTADGKTLYVADHNNGTDSITSAAPGTAKPGAMKIYAFQLNKQGEVKGKRRTVIDFGDNRGCDGMTLDENGHLYLTIRDSGRPGVLVLNPAGEELAFIPTGQPQPGEDNPKGLPSNVVFGIGNDAHHLYITVDTSLYRIPLKVKGIEPVWKRAK